MQKSRNIADENERPDSPKLACRHEAQRTGGRVRRSGFVVMRHSDDYISLFMPFFNIAMSFGDFFQRIAPVYDRFYLSRLNKLLEENQISGLKACRGFNGNIEPSFLQRSFTARRGTLACRVKNNIIDLTALGEILFSVIDDCIGSQGSYQFQIRGTAYPGNFRPKIFGKLYRKSPHTSGSAIDKNLMPAPDICLSEMAQCCNSPTGDVGGFLIGHIGRFYRHQPLYCLRSFFRQTFVLGISAETKPGKCKNLVTFLE